MEFRDKHSISRLSVVSQEFRTSNAGYSLTVVQFRGHDSLSPWEAIS
jgi:hypothetical protein